VETGAVPVDATTQNVAIPPRTTMAFDIDKIATLSHTDALVQLATNPEDFTVRTAYDAILEFVGTYTVTRTSSSRCEKNDELPPRLKAIRRVARRIERKIKRSRCSEARAVLQPQLAEVMDVWRSERAAVEEEKRAKIREQFRQARIAGNHHLAWRLAKLNLSGKGGGVKKSATVAISRAGWEAHFGQLFRADGGRPDVREVDVGRATRELFDDQVTHEEVTAALEKKKNLRAPGPDGFRVDFLRLVRYDETVSRAIANFFTLILINSEIPAEWDDAFLFVLYKGKGDPADANNFRGITLKSHFLKLFEAVLCNRFVTWLESEKLLPPQQLAYRQAMSGTDHLFLLNILIEDAMARGKTLFVGLIDLKKAFPSVDRKKLLEDLVSAGVSCRTVSVLRRLYSADTFRLLLDGVPGTVVFTVVVGVHEGSCLSPMLFVFFIRDLPHVLQVLTTNIDCPVAGLRKLFCMIFADDVSLFSFEQPGTQQLVDKTVDFFLERGLLPNPTKCEFVAFARRRTNGTFTVNSVARETQDMERYLGLFFSSDGKWNSQRQTSIARARAALGRCKIMVSTIGRHNVRVAIELFDSVVASVYRYGFGVWGPYVRDVRKMDDIFADFIRWLFRFPRTTGRDVILANFGRRCGKCDSLYLASVQLAAASGSRNSIWRDAVADMQQGDIWSKWFSVVSAERRQEGNAGGGF
jgi:hypothetical protein